MYTDKHIDSFYVNAIKILDYSKGSIQLKLITIIKNELKKLEKNTNIEIMNNKIYFSYSFILSLSKKIEFKKNSIIANQLFLKLRKKKLISKKSILYPKNIKYFSTNPLPRAFLDTNLKKLDKVIELKNTLIKNISSENSINDLYLYMYLRIFQIKKIQVRDILSFTYSNYIPLSAKLSIFVIVKQDADKYTPINIYFSDNVLNKIFNDISIAECNNQIFTKDIDYYENEVKKYLSKNNTSLREINNCVELEYQILKSPLSLSLMASKNHPNITLGELNHLFPNKIANYFLDIEKKNESIYFNTYDVINEDNEHVEVNDLINNYITKDIENFDNLLNILKIPLEKKKFDNFVKHWQKILNLELEKKCEILTPIYSCVLYLLNKADSTIHKKPIKIKTLKNYFSIMFNYCFKIIVAEGNVNEYTIRLINDNLIFNDNLTENSKRNYKRLINFYIKNYTKFDTIQKITMVIDIRRSVVFKDEFEKFVLEVMHEDKIYYTNAKNKYIKSTLRIVYSILLYYAGLRKNELRTRLVEDIVLIDDETLVIDVNGKGFRETMKSTQEEELTYKTGNAKRRVRFKISNKKHLEYVKKYLSWLEKNNYKFLFPAISQSGNLLKKHVIKENYINNLSSKLKNTTNRYTPLHSLRHSYCTFKTCNELKNGDKKQNIMFEISNLAGHSEPSITKINYLHLDLILLHLSNNLIE